MYTKDLQSLIKTYLTVFNRQWDVAHLLWPKRLVIKKIVNLSTQKGYFSLARQFELMKFRNNYAVTVRLAEFWEYCFVVISFTRRQKHPWQTCLTMSKLGIWGWLTGKLWKDKVYNFQHPVVTKLCQIMTVDHSHPPEELAALAVRNDRNSWSWTEESESSKSSPVCICYVHLFKVSLLEMQRDAKSWGLSLGSLRKMQHRQCEKRRSKGRWKCNYFAKTQNNEIHQVVPKRGTRNRRI